MKKFGVILIAVAALAVATISQVGAYLTVQNAKYGVSEIQTVGTAHNLTAYTLPGREAHLRYVFRVMQRPATANNTAVFALNPRDGAAYTLFTLNAATHSQTTIAQLADQIQYQVGSTNQAVANARGVLLRENDVLSITGSTNSVVRYRIEYVDIPVAN